MTADTLSGIVGVLLSLAFSYIPGLNSKFAGLEPVYKRLIMAGLLLICSLAIFGLACVGWLSAYGLELSCDVYGVQKLIGIFIMAMVANQSAYQLSPETMSVRIAKASR